MIMELLENIGLSPLNGEVAGRGLGKSGSAHDFFAGVLEKWRPDRLMQVSRQNV